MDSRSLTALKEEDQDRTIVPSTSTASNAYRSIPNIDSLKVETIGPISKAADLAQNRLDKYFQDVEFDPSSTQQKSIYTDADLQDIANLLRLSYKESWSIVPRLYTVLRRIDHLPLIELFLKAGCTDIWFPFNLRNLPSSLPTSIKTLFISAQPMIFTQALDLEKGENGKHATFATGELVWFESRGKLGKGSYGVVDKVVSLISLKEFARKRLRRGRDFTTSKREIQAFKTELANTKTINHHHCVRLKGSYTDPKYLGLIMEPVADGDLAAFLNATIHDEDKKSILRSFFGCLAGALQYLHEKHIRHRDIKPRNVLVKGNTVYLADFGLALDWTGLARGTTTEDTGKSLVYCAPEVARGERRGESADIWSLGCVFVEMISALKGRSVEELRSYFMSETESYSFHSNMEPCRRWLADLKSLSPRDIPPIEWSLRMLVFERTQRLTATQVLDSIRDASTNIPSSTSDEYFCEDCCVDDKDDSSSASSGADDPWADSTEDEMREAILSSANIIEDQKETSGSSGRSARASISDEHTIAPVRSLSGRDEVARVPESIDSESQIADPYSYRMIEKESLIIGKVKSTRNDRFLQAIAEVEMGWVEVLLQAGVNLTHANAYGNTALHLAVQSGSFETVQLLLRFCPDVLVKNKSGQIPLELTNRWGTIARLLREYAERPAIFAVTGAASESIGPDHTDCCAQVAQAR